MPNDKALWDYSPEEIARWRVSAYPSAAGRTWRRRTGRPPRPRDTDALVVWGWTVLAVLAPCALVYTLLVAPLQHWWPFPALPPPVPLAQPFPTIWDAESPDITARRVDIPSDATLPAYCVPGTRFVLRYPEGRWDRHLCIAPGQWRVVGSTEQARAPVTPVPVATSAGWHCVAGTVGSIERHGTPTCRAGATDPEAGRGTGTRLAPRVMAVPNEAATGTVKYRLAQHTGTGLRLSRDPTVPLFIVIAGAGTTGHVLVAAEGEALCEMDSTLTQAVGWYIVPAPQDLVGRCHAQATPPRTGYVVGTLLDATTERGQVARVQVGVVAFVPGTGTSADSAGQEGGQ